MLLLVANALHNLADLFSLHVPLISSYINYIILYHLISLYLKGPKDASHESQAVQLIPLRLSTLHDGVLK